MNESAFAPKPLYRVFSMPGAATPTVAIFPLPANSYASQFYHIEVLYPKLWI